MIFIKELWSAILQNWAIVIGIAAFIAAFTKWLADLYQIKNLRLQIRKLKDEIERQKTSTLSVPTLDEIIHYANKNPSPKELKKFLQLKFKSESINKTIYQLSDDHVSVYTDALSLLARKDLLDKNTRTITVCLASVLLILGIVKIIFPYNNSDIVSILFSAIIFLFIYSFSEEQFRNQSHVDFKNTSSTEDLVPGKILKGTITQIIRPGIIVNLGCEKFGFLHKSRIPTGMRLNVGDSIVVIIEDVSDDGKRISLLLR